MDLVLKGHGLCFFNKSSGFAEFENNCDVVNFGADSGLCLS